MSNKSLTFYILIAVFFIMVITSIFLLRANYKARYAKLEPRLAMVVGRTNLNMETLICHSNGLEVILEVSTLLRGQQERGFNLSDTLRIPTHCDQFIPRSPDEFNAMYVVAERRYGSIDSLFAFMAYKISRTDHLAETMVKVACDPKGNLEARVAGFDGVLTRNNFAMKAKVFSRDEGFPAIDTRIQECLE